MSTKFQRPSGAFLGDAALSNRTKYQDDAAAVPKVAISSSKIDGDFNYVIESLNTLDAASGTRASIDDRMSVVLNPDGTLKSSVVATVDDWVEVTGTMTRVSDTTFTVNSDIAALMSLGRRLKLVVGGSTVYGDVLSASFDGSLTSVEMTTAIITAVPSSVRYAPLAVNDTGAGQKVFADMEIRGGNPMLRVAKTGGGDFALRLNNGACVISQNTGTALAPVWTDKLTVNASGLALTDESITAAKLAHEGSAGNVLTAQSSGAPVYAPAIPSGSIMPFAGTVAPTGYLLCDGSAVSRGTYANLFTVIGESFGEGDNITTFNLPDLRGRTVFGADAGAGVMTSGLFAEAGGSESKTTEEHVLTVDQIPPHTHDYNAPSSYNAAEVNSNTPTGRHLGTHTTASTGGGLGHSHDFNALPPYLCLSYIIKT